MKRPTLCSQPDCDNVAIGEAWDTTRDDRPNAYCLEHLELARKLGFPSKTFSKDVLKRVAKCPKCGSRKTVRYPTCEDRLYCVKCGTQIA